MTDKYCGLPTCEGAAFAGIRDRVGVTLVEVGGTWKLRPRQMRRPYNPKLCSLFILRVSVTPC